MPLAVTHVLLTIILLDLFRDYIIKKKRLIPLHFIFIGGIAGLIPDIDIPIFWLLNLFKLNITWFHGTFTHLFLIPIAILAASLITYRYNKKAGILLGIISFGYGFHIFLDFLFYGCNISPFWPIITHNFNGLSHYLNIPGLEQGLDAFILLAWLWHEEVRHKISDFI
ncbi:MAG: metal-dependent hydrolase [Nanoarchaeota archaeon]|nr:metal-dependent hydrolase [Nanoarchaeota archaeon]MBU1004301.1 metal-dependent hydrolase [Nanoarchaeota archaeon]MBU1945481.1 metal-dependent hydrolase [Nanoarchaeota archaeon]